MINKSMLELSLARSLTAEGDPVVEQFGKFQSTTSVKFMEEYKSEILEYFLKCFKADVDYVNGTKTCLNSSYSYDYILSTSFEHFRSLDPKELRNCLENFIAESVPLIKDNFVINITREYQLPPCMGPGQGFKFVFNLYL